MPLCLSARCALFNTQPCALLTVEGAGLYYRGPSNEETACSQRCVNLEGLLHPRASAYFTVTQQDATKTYRLPTPAYVTGFCGSNATDASSELAVVRLVGMYAFPTAVGSCGNRMLNAGEDCDDGNVLGGDGCSPLCRVELTEFWDCDVIGQPCLRQCGWTAAALQVLLICRYS